MTVTIHNETFRAEAAGRKKDPTKYSWYQVTKGKITLDSHHNEFEVELKKGEKFGIKKYRDKYYLVDEDDLSLQFELSAKEVANMMPKVKGFTGKIDGKDVNPGTLHDPVIKPGVKANARDLDKQYRDAAYAVQKLYKDAYVAHLTGDAKSASPRQGSVSKAVREAVKAAKLLSQSGKRVPKLRSIGAVDFFIMDEIEPSQVASIVKDQKSATLEDVDPKAARSLRKEHGSSKPASGGKRANADDKRDLRIQYDKALTDLYTVFYSPLSRYLRTGKGKVQPPKTKVSKPLRAAHKAAQALMEVSGKLPKHRYSSVADYYKLGELPLAESLKLPVPDLEEIDKGARSLRRYYMNEHRENIKMLTEALENYEDNPTKATLKYLQSRAEPARDAVAQLEFFGEKLPAGKKHRRAIELYASKSPAKAAPKSKAQSHPGHHVPQGSVPTQDRSGEAAKRVTDKNIRNFLKKQFGIETTRSRAGVFAGNVGSMKTIREMRRALESAGWKANERTVKPLYGKSNGRPRKVLSFALPGGTNTVEITTTGVDRGALTVVKHNSSKK